jgi:hypothetical protein
MNYKEFLESKSFGAHKITYKPITNCEVCEMKRKLSRKEKKKKYNHEYYYANQDDMLRKRSNRYFLNKYKKLNNNFYVKVDKFDSIV